MESSENLPTGTHHDEERPEGDAQEGVHGSDERPALRARALAALQQTRVKANGNVSRTRVAVEAIEEDCLQSLEDSRIMRTMRLDPDKVRESLSDATSSSSGNGEVSRAG